MKLSLWLQFALGNISQTFAVAVFASSESLPALLLSAAVALIALDFQFGVVKRMVRA